MLKQILKEIIDEEKYEISKADMSHILENFKYIKIPSKYEEINLKCQGVKYYDYTMDPDLSIVYAGVEPDGQHWDYNYYYYIDIHFPYEAGAEYKVNLKNKKLDRYGKIVDTYSMTPTQMGIKHDISTLVQIGVNMIKDAINPESYSFHKLEIDNEYVSDFIDFLAKKMRIPIKRAFTLIDDKNLLLKLNKLNKKSIYCITNEGIVAVFIDGIFHTKVASNDMLRAICDIKFNITRNGISAVESPSTLDIYYMGSTTNGGLGGDYLYRVRPQAIKYQYIFPNLRMFNIYKKRFSAYETYDMKPKNHVIRKS